MRNLMKPALILCIICCSVALCLALVNYFTKDIIKQRTEMEAEEQRKQVIHEAQSFKSLAGWKGKDQSGIIREVYAAYHQRKLAGYVLVVFPKGYGGEIKVTVGLSADGRISGVNIGENNETPGLGAKAAEDGFLNQYSQKKIQNTLQVVKRKPLSDNEIQAISGATITSKAVTGAVQAAMELGQKLIMY
ncbi:MAG: RnfABCDGE type electron transport complex subunit G [Firmicutes bacterium]|nr:RnfABCDGE type electron transport complex subunit G [Bacillota bacterium]